MPCHALFSLLFCAVRCPVCLSSSLHRNRVEKTVLLSSSVALSGAAAAAKPASSLDQALDLIKGPKAISTVVKSSTDWDNFKEKEGLNDDLAAASKDGYVHACCSLLFRANL